MLGDDDVAWLEEMAYGAADGTVLLVSPSPPRSPEAGTEALRVNPIHAVSEAGLEVDLGEKDNTRINIDDLLGDDEVREIEVPPPQQEPNQEVTPVSKGKRTAADVGDSQRVSKKHRSHKSDKSHKSGSRHSGSSRQHRSLPIDEGFARRSYEDYVADPVSAVVNVTLYLSDLMKEERDKADLRLTTVQKERDNETKLKEDAWISLSEARNQLKSARESLTILSGDLKAVEKLRDDLSILNANQKEKIARLETQIGELEGQKSLLTQKVEELTLKVTELENLLKTAVEKASSSSDPSDRIAELEARLKAKDAEIAAAEEKARKTAQLSMKMKEHGFQLALKQVQVINPAMGVLEDSVLQHHHSVEDGKIVKVDRASKSKTVVYPPPSN